MNAAKKYNKIVQAGTQIRSGEGLREAVEWIQAGNLGKITVARGFCYKRRDSIGKTTGPQPVPATVNYDLWTGPAPLVPPHPQQPALGPDSLRLALGLPVRQRRRRQPGHPPDGRRALVPRRVRAAAPHAQHRRPPRLRRRRRDAEHAGRHPRLRDGAADLRGARASGEGRHRRRRRRPGGQPGRRRRAAWTSTAASTSATSSTARVDTSSRRSTSAPRRTTRPARS